MTEVHSALVVDDERNLRFIVGQVLASSGFRVTVASSGEEALGYLRDTSFDLAILDLKLGGHVDGMKLFGAIRWRWPGTAIVILTGHGSLETAVEAIREGIDGYLLKPVEANELRQVARTAVERRRAFDRHAQDQASHQLEQGSLWMDLDKYLVTRDGQPINLTAQEFRLLRCLMQNAHRVVTPKELVRIVREYDPESTYEARQIIKWYIHHLRQKIEPNPSQPRYILNVRGVGYRLGE